MDAVTSVSRLAPADPVVQIRVLGAVEVVRGTEAPQVLRGRLAHVLGVLVEAAPRGVQRVDLTDQLWEAGDGGALDPLLSR
ncbi:MAG: hypothetical protein Q7T55_17190, partial [Solirubrobacteraceae bacterium]|nr:hypothetical protein [Solirubrobacteraceae bacterium]